MLKLIAISLSFLSLLPLPTLAQTGQGRLAQPKVNEGARISDADLAEAQRRDFAISTVISLAREANSYSDLALRPRVLSRAADILWDADNADARALFLRAWEAAEKGDAEEVTIKTKDSPPPMVIALRRAGGRDLRSEVLSVVARRDRKLAEEFLAKLNKETEREAKDSKPKGPVDNWSASDADSKRLLTANRLLNEGQVEQALEIASPALDQVNAMSIGFLSVLRTRNPDAADQRFSRLVTLAEFNSLSDANTVSGLSSYVFTPGVYITFTADGGGTWSESEPAMAPPNLPAILRDQFVRVAAKILLRSLPPPDRDFSSSGRPGTIKVISRLLPIFQQYAPDSATALRAYLTELTGSSSRDTTKNGNPLLTLGLKEDEPRDLLERLQDEIDHAKTSRERDDIYASVAVTLAAKGDLRARELADKVDDSDRRFQLRQFVDFQLVQVAVGKKAASEAVRLAETGQLSHTQRALAYTQAARLVMKSERQRGSDLLEKATDEAMRIETNALDRPVVFVGIAIQLTIAEPSRVWDLMARAAKTANETENFNGENGLQFLVPTRLNFKTIRIGGDDFSLSHIFRLLARDDLYRSIEVGKSFKNEAPRSTAILAIASAILDKQSR